MRTRRCHNDLDEEARRKAFNTHVDQAGNCTCSRIGMERREYEINRERRMDAHMRGLGVLHFADHDHIGVLPQKGTQRQAKVKPIVGCTWVWLTPAI